MRKYIILLITIISLNPTNLLAWDEAGSQLENTQQEERARKLFKELRCIVCSGESINDSNADMAKDMRLVVREKISQGETNEEIIKYFYDRYGDTILLEPKLKDDTYILWLSPFIFIVIGVIIIIMSIKSNGNSANK